MYVLPRIGDKKLLWLRWIKQMYEQNNNNFVVDVTEFQKFYDKVQQQMQQKLSYLNLLYEISRLYFIIRSSKYRDELIKSHHIGIKMNLFECKEMDIILNYKSVCSALSIQDNVLLNEDDADILSLSKKRSQNSFDCVPEEIFNETDFYITNKIF